MAEADPERSIPPSIVDGLKPGQRKVLFCCFERNLVKQIKVTQLICYALERAAYQHGEQSLASTIVSMAQNFVGSNNIGLLVPDGPYGTRHRGGEDAALSFEAVYSLLTRLPPITRLIFPKDDDVLLDYLSQDGKSVEPRWYMPIIPMVLVNGSGIGTGSSSYVPNYNPRDITANLKRLLNGETVVPMDPWYKGFKGSLKKTCSKGVSVTYTITGVIEQVDDTKLIITELPVRCWTEDYRKFLDSMCPVPIKKKKKDNDKERNKEPSFLVEEYRSQCDHANVEIEVILSENNVNIAKQEGLEKKFNMTTTIGTTNMQLFDSDGKIRKYDTPEDILKEFFKLRLEFYGRRKAVMLQNIEKELSKPKNKARFIFAVNSGDIVVSNRKRAELLLELKQKGYEPSPNEKTTAKQVGGENDYDYLLEMAIRTLTLEKVRELVAEQKKLEDEFESLGKTTPETLWLRDLDALEKEMDVLDAEFEAEQEETRRRRENYLKDEKESKEAPKRRPKKTSYKSQKENLAGSRDDDFETKPAAQKKIPVKKASAPVRHDDDEALNLKDRLAAYNIGDSPPERSAVESETAKEQKGKERRNEPSKKGMTKKAMAPLTELSGQNEDNKFTVEGVRMEKKTRGRKHAAEKPKKTTIRKRAPAQSNFSAPSPEKKVRHMRDSPFDKKGGSVSQRVASASTSAEDAEAPPPSGSSAQPVAPRRSARLKQSTSMDGNV